MKSNYKRFNIALLVLVLITVNLYTSKVFAMEINEQTEVFETDVIPERMAAKTIIKFIDDNHYIILREGVPISQETAEQAEKDAEMSLNEAAALQGIKPEEVQKENVLPDIYQGLIVYYGDDGYLYDISDESENSVEPYGYSITGGTWGNNYTNTVTIGSDDVVYGSGRATVFVDSIGQVNRNLRKGDIATSLKYDNCRCGITVNVYMQKNNSSTIVKKEMLKYDAGALPDAVIDIWKTGVEYWGYSYSDTWSRLATYNHDNAV